MHDLVNLLEMNEYYLVFIWHNHSSRYFITDSYLYIDPLPWCSLLFLNFSLWLDGVLPLVMDREATAQEKCFQILEEVLLSNIVPHSKLVAQLTVRMVKHFKFAHFATMKMKALHTMYFICCVKMLKRLLI